MNIKGKIVFITGASSGIGMESAKAFAKEGCKLILTARRIDRIKILAAELLNEFGTESLTLPLDVRKKEEVFTLFEKLPNDWKKIDILLNNAGVGKGLSPLHDSDPEAEYQETVNKSDALRRAAQDAGLFARRGN